MAERHRWPSIGLGPSLGGRVFMGITGPHQYACFLAVALAALTRPPLPPNIGHPIPRRQTPLIWSTAPAGGERRSSSDKGGDALSSHFRSPGALVYHQTALYHRQVEMIEDTP
jgi:hypothetical protein